MRGSLVPLIVVLAAAAPAAAQSHYVGASLVGDIARFSRVQIESGIPELIPSDPSVNGEALGGSVVVGTALGERWGIELGFVRPAAIDNFSSDRFPSLTEVPVTFPFPNVNIELTTEERHTTIDAMLWARQDVNDHFDLVYLGGVTFSHAEVTRRYRLSDPSALGITRISLPPNTHVDDHGVGPALGVEGRWKLGEHFSVVPGLRLHGVSVAGRPGWLIRPSIGVRWRF